MAEMDESDRRLVEALKQQMAQGHYEVGVDGRDAAPQDGADAGSGDDPSSQVRHTTFSGSIDDSAQEVSGQDGVSAVGEQDMAFNQAMNAYRAARAAGDSQAMAEAQARMQEVVRAEMAQQEQPCNDQPRRR